MRLVSNTLPTLQSDFKVRIDDIRNRIDIVMTNREMFFEKEHIGNLLRYNEKMNG